LLPLPPLRWERAGVSVCSRRHTWVVAPLVGAGRHAPTG
jgi:hypothetical protein